MFESNFQRVVDLLLSDLGGPASVAVRNALQREDALDRIAAMAIDPNSYGDADSFFRDYQAIELLRKLDLPGNLVGLEKKAFETFLACEVDCAETNMRLKPLVNNYYGGLGEMAVRVIPFIQSCKDFIADVLGSIPAELTPKFGKGATYKDRVPLTTIPDKMSSRPTVTDDCYAVVRSMFERTAWSRATWECESSWAPRPPEFVRGNRFTTVAKDNQKRRGICVEPSINVGYQLAVGSYLKSRILLKTGLDLSGPPSENVASVGQLLHRQLARQASIDGKLATVDLSNASDTISRELVRLMLPTAWYELLDSLRSKTTLANGRTYYLEKFSSMGNGFTFELETLLFAALVRGCGGKIGEDSFVYGDDIITPTKVASDLLPCLKFFGLTPNKRKTFLTGNFRESCGGDYFLGKAVRPHYIKELPNEPQDWIKLANGLRRVGRNDPGDVLRWYRFRRAWFCVLSNLPTHIRRLRGPEWLEDLVIHDDSWPSVLGSDGIWRWRVYAPIAKPIALDHFRPSVQLAAALLGVPSEGPVPRGNVAGYKVKWVPSLTS
mgnify:CR=1 FL=1